MESPKFSKVGINLKVKDFKKSQAFYDAFGFKKLFEFGPDLEERSKFRGMFYEVGNTLFEISEGHMAVKPEVFAAQIQNSKVSLMVYVESLIPILDICEARGVDIYVKPRQFPWGQIGVIVKDPDGFIVAFLADVSDEEQEKVQARTDLPLIRPEPDYTDAHVLSVQARSSD
jgi:catechol 2,3-dioxygenase-like lactoylglutathione lyase family enzyme